jgi:hypothetical protein
MSISIADAISPESVPSVVLVVGNCLMQMGKAPHLPNKTQFNSFEGNDSLGLFTS